MKNQVSSPWATRVLRQGCSTLYSESMKQQGQKI